MGVGGWALSTSILDFWNFSNFTRPLTYRSNVSLIHIVHLQHIDHLTWSNIQMPLRSSISRQLVIPRRNLNLGQHAFSVAPPNVAINSKPHCVSTQNKSSTFLWRWLPEQVFTYTSFLVISGVILTSGPFITGVVSSWRVTWSCHGCVYYRCRVKLTGDMVVSWLCLLQVSCQVDRWHGCVYSRCRVKLTGDMVVSWLCLLQVSCQVDRWHGCVYSRCRVKLTGDMVVSWLCLLQVSCQVDGWHGRVMVVFIAGVVSSWQVSWLCLFQVSCQVDGWHGRVIPPWYRQTTHGQPVARRPVVLRQEHELLTTDPRQQTADYRVRTLAHYFYCLFEQRSL